MSDRKGGTAYIDVKVMNIHPYKCCISDQVCPLLARQHGEGKENGRLWWYDENFDLLAMLIKCVQVNKVKRKTVNNADLFCCYRQCYLLSRC